MFVIPGPEGVAPGAGSAHTPEELMRLNPDPVREAVNCVPPPVFVRVPLSGTDPVEVVWVVADTGDALKGFPEGAARTESPTLTVPPGETLT
jgi:hypothetical protein